MDTITSSLLGAVAAVVTISAAGLEAGTASAAPAVDAAMTTITDDLGLLSVDVPAAWSFAATSPTTTDTGEEIVRLGASADPDGYDARTASGLLIQSGRFAMISVVALTELAPEECTSVGPPAAWTHVDVEAGMTETFDCGATTIQLAVGNIVNEDRSLVVRVQLLPVDAGLAERILASVDYLGNGPNAVATPAPTTPPEPTSPPQPTAPPEPTAPQPTDPPGPTSPRQPTAPPEPTAPPPTEPQPTAPPEPTAPPQTTALDVAGARAGLLRFLDAVPHRGVNVACPVVNHEVLSRAMANRGLTIGGNRWTAARTVIGAIDNQPALRCYEPDGTGLSPTIDVFDISALGGLEVLATSSWGSIADDPATGGELGTVCHESGGTPHCSVTWHADGLVVRLAITAWVGSIEADEVASVLQGLLPTLISNLARYEP